MKKIKSLINEKSLIFISAVNIFLIANLVNEQYRNMRISNVDIDYDTFIYIGLLSVVMTIIQLFVLRILIINEKRRTEYALLKNKISNMEELNRLNKMQRHDLRNHLTVIKGLLHKGNIDSLRNYIDDLINESYTSSFNIDTGIKELDILIESKFNKANKKNIIFQCATNSKISSFSIKPFDIIKIISNIIDNSIDALDECDKQDKKINIFIDEDFTNYIFQISNNGNRIIDEDMEKIFQKGYSTKLGQGRGMGLYIVFNTIRKYNGFIDAHSSDEKTTFTISIPKINL